MRGRELLQARQRGVVLPSGELGLRSGDCLLGTPLQLARSLPRVACRNNLGLQVVRLAGFRRGAVRRPAEAAGWVEGCEHTHVVAPAEELLGKRLDVPVHAALIGPGIWRDKRDAHEELRVTAG